MSKQVFFWNSNFIQLFRQNNQNTNNPDIPKWLERKKYTYTSLEIQNECLEIMANKTLRNMAENIKTSGMFSLMANKTADIANTEQLVICLR